MLNHLSKDTLEKISQSRDISKLDINQIKSYFLEETAIANYAPDGICQVDPRNGDRIVFNSARARRPHDNRPAVQVNLVSHSENDCIICQGKTTQVLDIASLSEGYTFINKNLYPIFYPQIKDDLDDVSRQIIINNGGDPHIEGYHFLQWTSSYHDKDWHNMPLGDRLIVLQRLAALEKKMLTGSEFFVSIIKNYGRLVGGSLVHGHQQIGVSKIIPNHIRQDMQFQKKTGESFTEFMLRENPSNLIIHEYSEAVLLTPYFMRRPYDMILLLKDPQKSYIHLINEKEQIAVSDGWRDAIRIMLKVMPLIGKEVAYNITTHNGLGGGLYFEFLPYTQEMGGFEHLGLYLCQGNPSACSKIARELLDEYSD